jgi:hypothetical protein
MIVQARRVPSHFQGLAVVRMVLNVLGVILLPNPHYTKFRVHPFFRGIDWANIHRYPAPFCPELHNLEDTRHFDDNIPAEVS